VCLWRSKATLSDYNLVVCLFTLKIIYIFYFNILILIITHTTLLYVCILYTCGVSLTSLYYILYYIVLYKYILVIDKPTRMFHIKIKYVVTDSIVVSVLEISNVFLAVFTFRCRWLCPLDGDTSNGVVTWSLAWWVFYCWYCYDILQK
jgi:hypothetical protein